MITTVTLNAAIDRTYWVNGWEKGGVFRTTKVLNEPGGKGVNVAKVLKLLGGEVQATGFSGGQNGNTIRNALEERGIHAPFLEVDGESRVCLNIIDESDETSTELLERGPEISDQLMQRMRENLSRLASQSSIVVLSGSLPPSLSVNAYHDLALVVKAAGAQVFLDTSGAALTAGIKSRPDLIKPNEEELRQLFDEGIDFARLQERDLATQIVKLAHERELPRICVTLGSEGAIAYICGTLYRAYAPRIRPINTVGCGDSFVAGMAYATDKNLEATECLRIAVAAATANALDERAGYVNYDIFQDLLPQVRVDQWG